MRSAIARALNNFTRAPVGQLLKKGVLTGRSGVQLLITPVQKTRRKKFVICPVCKRTIKPRAEISFVEATAPVPQPGVIALPGNPRYWMACVEIRCTGPEGKPRKKEGLWNIFPAGPTDPCGSPPKRCVWVYRRWTDRYNELVAPVQEGNVISLRLPVNPTFHEFIVP